MTILDHRILIPKSPEKIWEFLSDISRNAEWQVDCSEVSLLTSKRSGAGVRWRYTSTGGRSYVVETTAWYDGLGYEYTFVDGGPFKESKGRIRLQEIAEGTVVQWTLTYETSGMLAGVRNAIGLKRQFESAMIDSLKNLWKVIQKVIPDDKPREVKSLMRDAPDYESRTHYRSRYPTGKPDDDYQEVLPEKGISAIVEPPISLEDTRPRAPVRAELSPVEVAPESTEVPEATRSEFAPPLPSPVTEDAVVSELAASTTLPETADEIPDPFAAANETARVYTDVPTVARTITQESHTVSTPVEPTAVVETPKPMPAASFDPVPSYADTVKMETGEMSVFDLFGIPRPSQTQEMRPVVIPDEVEQILTQPAAQITVQPSRIGLRLVLRRKHVKIRRPV